MATYTWGDTVTRAREFVLPAEWPQGAAIGELRKMMAHVEQELREALGDQYGFDTDAWVISGDNEIVIRFEKPKPDTFRTGKCSHCTEPAEYRSTQPEPGSTEPGSKACPAHAAKAVVTGYEIQEMAPRV
jgi:hypothetical protein